MNINKKQRDLFQELSKYPNRNRSYQELADDLNVSTRSIRNYCAALEDYIREMGIASLIEKTSTGISYTGTAEQTQEIWSRIGGGSFYEYHLSPDDRILAIVLILLSNNAPITVMELCDTLFVSRATILHDIEKVKVYFQQFQIEFDPSTNRGYSLNIEESKRQETICTTCFPYLKNWDPQGEENEMLHFLFDSLLHLADIVPAVCRIVQDAERRYGIDIGDIFYKQIVLMLSILCRRLIQGHPVGAFHLPDIRLQDAFVGKIAQMMLNEAEDAFHICYTNEEILYLAWHLHLYHFDLLQNFEHSVDLYLYMEVHQFLQKVGEELHCTSFGSQRFSIMLTHHIWGMQDGSLEKSGVTAEELNENYYDCCQAVRKHIGIIEHCIGRPCTEPEFASILLYVIAEIERRTRTTEKPRVIILCHVGIGTANYLADRLLETFNLEIPEVTAIHRLPEVIEADHFDLLISTVPLKLDNIPWVNVSPNLTDSDIIAVQKALTTIHRNRRLSLARQTPAKQTFQKQTPAVFTELLKPDHIILDVPCSDWHEALDIAAEPLIGQKEIHPRYVEAIKHSVEINGPYFVFCPGVALAHAAPSDGVRRFCLSIYRPESPVQFHHKSNDPVYLVIMIGITDVNTQVSCISALMDVFRQKELRGLLTEARSAEELISVFSENS